MASDPLQNPLCPAASPIAGPDPLGPSIICGVIANDRREGTSGVGITAAAAGFERLTADGVLLTVAKDPSSVTRFCCGRGLPVLDDREGYGRDHYSFCPVWQAEKDRIAAGKAELGRPVEPESVASEGFDVVGGELGTLDDLVPQG